MHDSNGQSRDEIRDEPFFDIVTSDPIDEWDPFEQLPFEKCRCWFVVLSDVVPGAAQRRIVEILIQIVSFIQLFHGEKTLFAASELVERGRRSCCRRTRICSLRFVLTDRIQSGHLYIEQFDALKGEIFRLCKRAENVNLSLGLFFTTLCCLAERIVRASYISSMKQVAFTTDCKRSDLFHGDKRFCSPVRSIDQRWNSVDDEMDQCEKILIRLDEL